MRDFELVQVIGRGTSGVVYLAEQRSTATRVALKRLASGNADVRALSRFRREAAALAAVEAHGVVRIIELFDDGGELWLATEYVDGATLADITPMADEAALLVVEQLAIALDAVHRAGIVHRDVKPANVLVDRKGECRLVDFGLARFLSDTLHVRAGGGFRTRTGVLLGTPSHLAPELFDGDASAASDIYSLGVVAYELFVGRVPFIGPDIVSVVEGHRHGAPPDPTVLRPATNDTLATALLAPLAKSPTKRPPTASALFAAIERGVSPAPGWRDRARMQLADAVQQAADRRPASRAVAAASTAGETIDERVPLPRAALPVFHGRRTRRLLVSAATIVLAAVLGYALTRL